MIDSPTEEDIEGRFKGYMMRNGYTQATQSQYIRTLKQFFRFTDKKGIYPDIAAEVKGIKAPTTTSREAFDSSDIVSILDKIDTTDEAGKRDYFMIRLAVTAGLRVIEMYRANIGNIEKRKGFYIMRVQGKGHRSADDYVEFSAAVADAYEDYMTCRPSAKPSDPLFTVTGNRHRIDPETGEPDTRINKKSMSRIIKDRLKAAGYDSSHLTAHSLRHTSITEGHAAGLTLEERQIHARHCDPKVTQRYDHTDIKKNLHSAQKIDDQIFHPGEKTKLQCVTEMVQELNENQLQAVINFIGGLKNE
jgi:integrase/recombinase XerC